MAESEFERYVSLYRQSVWQTALCIVRNVSDADDVTQDVFLKLYTYTDSFESDEHVKAWLLRCTVNRSRDILRSHWYRFSEPLESAFGSEYAGCIANGDEDSSLLPALMKLSRKNRTALYLHYYEGYTVEQLARILHIKESAVKLRLMRGRGQLKKILTDEREGSENGLQGNI